MNLKEKTNDQLSHAYKLAITKSKSLKKNDPFSKEEYLNFSKNILKEFERRREPELNESP